MSIIPDTTSSGLTTSGTSLTVSQTITTNTNRVLWVFIVGSLVGDLISGVTYGGAAMTFIQHVQISSNRWSCLWKLIAPVTGTNNIVATSSSADRIELYASSYYNVLQIITPDSVTTNTTLASTSITGTATVSTNQSWLIAGFNPAGNGTGAGAGAFARIVSAQNTGIYDSNAAYSVGSHSMTINCQANPTTIILSTMEPIPNTSSNFLIFM